MVVLSNPGTDGREVPGVQISTSLRIQNTSIQKSKVPKIQNNLQDSVDVKSLGFLDFWVFGFLDFCSRCLIAVMDKWAKCEFLRVVGG